MQFVEIINFISKPLVMLCISLFISFVRVHLHQASCVKRHASSIIDASLVFIGVYDAIHT